MKGFIASSISVFTFVGVTAAAMPVLAQQTTQHTQMPKSQQTTQAQSTPQNQSTTQAKVITRAVYRCDEGKGFSAVYRTDGTAETTFGSKVIMLNQVESGSGARYSNGSVTLYIKGDTGFVEVGDDRLFTNCVATGGGVHGMW